MKNILHNSNTKYRLLKNMQIDLNYSNNHFTIFFINKKIFSSFYSNIIYDPNNDFYKVLNIPDKAELKEIKKSFYKLSLECHPDKGGNEEVFKKINNAYETLKDEQHKKHYDLLRTEYLASLDIKFNLKNKNYYYERNNDKEYKNNNTNSKSSSSKNNHDYNSHGNFYQNFYREKDQEYKRKDSSNEYRNYDYSKFYKSYDFNDFQNKRKKADTEFYDKFYDYYEDIVNRAKSNFKEKWKFHENTEKQKHGTNKDSNDKKSKIIRDRANDFNYLNDSLTFSKLDNRTNNFFETFKINRLHIPQKDIKFEKFIFKENNLHFSENRMKILDKELNEYDKNSYFKKKFILKEKPKFKNNPYEFNSIKYSENSQFNINDDINSKEENDSEGVNSIIKVKHYFTLMNKKVLFLKVSIVFFINYLLFRKSA